MNIKEKELELLESSLEKAEIGRHKYDSMSASLLISSIILFTTSSPESSIKLAFLGIELKSLYAVYLLYLFSLISASNCILLYAKKGLLYTRYKTVLCELYGETPLSLDLIDSDDYTLRKMLFQGRWNIINRTFHCLVSGPLLVSYFWLGKALVSFNGVPVFIKISSFLIVVFGFYLIPLLLRAVYVDWKAKNELDYSIEKSKG